MQSATEDEEWNGLFGIGKLTQVAPPQTCDVQCLFDELDVAVADAVARAVWWRLAHAKRVTGGGRGKGSNRREKKKGGVTTTFQKPDDTPAMRQST
jgi:hypothetical protein